MSYLPSPHNPSKTGVNALKVGEGDENERSEFKPGEGVPVRYRPLTRFAASPLSTLSHKGRGKKDYLARRSRT
ncbi:hypothetical protein CRBSH125_18240 [Afipia carboxidovorans]|nr:hypothetical protein CRBSH125_18240 [Afipia carboxidovorans]